MEVGEFLDKLRVELKISKNSDHTLRNYVRANQALLNYTNKLPSDITPDDVKLYMADNLADKASSSIILFLAAVKYAHFNILGVDPTVKIKRPRKERHLPVVLSKEEVTSILSAIENKKSHLMISILYACGLRVSELVNLKVLDLDFAEKVGHVRQGKGRKDRIFNIPESLSQKLQEQANLQRTQQQEHLFSGPLGALSPRNIQKIVETSARNAGIEKHVHPHTMRHSFATHLLESGVDIRMIQELLGHADLSTTQQYAHVSTKQLKKIKSPLDELN